MMVIAEISGYPIPEQVPQITVAPLTIELRRTYPAQSGGQVKNFGLFMSPDQIKLDSSLDIIGNIDNRAVLVHELVHYMQYYAVDHAPEILERRLVRHQKKAAQAGCEGIYEVEFDAFLIERQWVSRERRRHRLNSIPRAKLPHFDPRLYCRP